MEFIECVCGCGQLRPKYDPDGRQRYYLKGHNNRNEARTEAQRKAWRESLKKRPKVPWNKGRTYTHSSKKAYANKSSWNAAMRRLYPDTCMRCGWNEASCDTHHILPKCNGGKYSITNGIILCPNCHRLADSDLIGVAELQAIKQATIMTGEII